jgi:hypothetical protein
MARRWGAADDLETPAVKQLKGRLLADMRGRLWGKRDRPSRAECEGWGARTIPWTMPLAGGCLTQIFGIGVALNAIFVNSPLMLAGAAMAMLLIWPIGFMSMQWAQRRRDFAAYRKQLAADERFALTEYNRLLGRQIPAASSNPSLGGPTEVERLLAAQAELQALLDSGAGLDRMPAQSALGDEAVLAQSVVEAYKIGEGDHLESLDARLPAEIRTRLEDLEGGTGEGGQRERE